MKTDKNGEKIYKKGKISMKKIPKKFRRCLLFCFTFLGILAYKEKECLGHKLRRKHYEKM